ncbi:glycerophosphoryl diester phosphodiesterase membrane domain-containing protein [Microbacterium luticocti]|uniref:glycerophosphoryl diester phosphodiesterase membrane domain-containing protein n=1 Tax=Microbacterium luticocti TaxID=451764 RepID=UPI00041FB3CC|nr:glycerophosphoryl diester phosphodiesterase membrane domain-containing protein [Microbacterium luticocti]
MTATPTWTPASRPGIIPLHPLGFGTVLGRSFAALRRNPRVLLGFALVVQIAAFLVLIGAIGAISFWAFSRLDNVPLDSPDRDAISAGSVAITIVAGLVLGLAASALGVIVQGVVVADVARGALAEKLRLREIWQQVRPVAWRLIGYSLLLSAAMVLVVAVIGGLVLGLATVAVPLAIALTVLAVLGGIVAGFWISTKLALVAPTIILEKATIREGIVRSWRLTRGRFWPIFGIVVVIQLIFGTIAQVISFPFSLFGGILSAFIAPTGAPDTSAIISMLVTVGAAEVMVLLIQSIATVVQSTAYSILYIDCRMRHEGLDLDLLAYVERRDAGAHDLPDPYTQHIGRAFARPVAAPGYPSVPGQPYPPGAYPQAPGYPPQYGARMPQPYPSAQPPAPYGQAPQAPYGQAPQAPYGQAPQAPYGQAPQAPYGQAAQAPYGQAPYGQAPQALYGQAPQAPSGQASQAPYAQAAQPQPPSAGPQQPTQAAYGHASQAPSGQAPYGQAPQAPYGQAPAQPPHGQMPMPPAAPQQPTQPGPGHPPAPSPTQWTAPTARGDEQEAP